MTRVLVVTSVDAERDAVVHRLGDVRPLALGRYDAVAAATAAGEVVVLTVGVGAAAAAAATGTATALRRFDAVVCAGVAGGFPGRAEVGDLVVATTVVAADLGAATPDGGFLTVDDLGLQPATLEPGVDVSPVAARLDAVAGPVLTVSTVTGTDTRASYLAERWEAVAEAMEGYGVWWATPPGVPRFEVRAVSNRVGRRDRASWDIPAALRALGHGCGLLFAESLEETLT